MTSPFPRVRSPHFDNVADASLKAEVLRGLMSDHKHLPPKLFYDEIGAELFERICELPEYYLTRDEMEILNNHADDIAERLGERVALIEYGSGAGIKVRLLLDALKQPVAYVPIDISGAQLAAVSKELRKNYRDIVILPVEADYTKPVQLPALPAGARKVVFFPGSTIGNFHPTEAAAFLRRVRNTIGKDGAVVLGVDRTKSASVLEAAYNDAAGVTAEFNLNVLTRLNREFGANFDRRGFEHRAQFDQAAQRVDMFLVSKRDQQVTVAGEKIDFRSGEAIWTESSYKYSEDHLRALASLAGLAIADLWSDHRNRFWVAVLETA